MEFKAGADNWQLDIVNQAFARLDEILAMQDSTQQQLALAQECLQSINTRLVRLERSFIWFEVAFVIFIISTVIFWSRF